MKRRFLIVFLMSDQLRVTFLGSVAIIGSYSNLDNLAREGVNFRKANSSVPSCNPARIGILEDYLTKIMVCWAI